MRAHGPLVTMSAGSLIGMRSLLDPRPMEHRTPRTVDDWDAIRAWTDVKYMHFAVRPVGRATFPASSMYSISIGGIILTHFSYGVHVKLDDFDSESGNVLALTTVRGRTRHGVPRNAAELSGDQTFVVDCGHTPYRLDADQDHLQLNLTVPDRLLTDLALRWYGDVPSARLWSTPCVIGGPSSPWLALLDFATRTAAAAPDDVAHGRVGRQLEEMLAAQLLTEWARHAGVDLTTTSAVPAPGYVRTAVHYIDEHARDLPTIAEIAQVAGVSVRALSGAFAKYLGTSPRRYLVERRLQGVRRELTSGTQSVAAAAHAWGYVNMGSFAGAYRRRFGELPSQTLRRATRN